MVGLVVLAVIRALREPYDVTTWSLVASKFVVPFVLMHIAVLVFREPSARLHFEIFNLVALSYLIFTALAFLFGANSLIFPRNILDGSLGHHIERARGPFLQAVANGLSMNLLGILVLILPIRHSRIARLLWILLPLAVLATMTRTVWIAFALSTFAVAMRIGNRGVRRACAAASAGSLALLLVVLAGHGFWSNTFRDRTEDRGPVDSRLAVYQAGWEMFEEHPLTGWTAGGMYTELGRRTEGYHMRAFYIHNTYLSLLIELGLPGFVLYGILLAGLFRLARADLGDGVRQRGAVSNLRKAWPILLGVYLVNACFVDMVYQFVNGLIFTVAGMLYASREADA
jgi:O-antigen ligase